MLNWLRGKKTALQDPTTPKEERPPPIRKPTHALRDARMSAPVAEREYYETIRARKAAGYHPLTGTSVSGTKHKRRSPWTYDSGTSSFTSTPPISEHVPQSGSNESQEDLVKLWNAVAEKSRRYSSAPTSTAESSKDPAMRESNATDCDKPL